MSGVICGRKGCGNRFEPSENTDDACTYHPGNPDFHDAEKGWSCCSKRVRDFDAFMTIEGCTKGKHATKEELKALNPPSTTDNTTTTTTSTTAAVTGGSDKFYAHYEPGTGSAYTKPFLCDSRVLVGVLETFVKECNASLADTQLSTQGITVHVGNASAPAITYDDHTPVNQFIRKGQDVYILASNSTNNATTPTTTTTNDTTNASNTSNEPWISPVAQDQVRKCLSHGCGLDYKETENTDEACRHHPGKPIFHDCLQGYTCCDPRTTNFDDFLKIEPCHTGRHSDEPLIRRSATVVTPEVKRERTWSQDSDTVTVHLPLSGVVDKDVDADFDDESVMCTIKLDSGKTYCQNIEFFAEIDPSDCKVTCLADSVDIKVKKAESGKWRVLES